MEDSEFSAQPAAPTASSAQPKPRWGLRIGLGACAAILLVAIFFIFRLFLPVWWATRISNQTQGSLSGGVLLGLAYGFIFTFVPLLIGWQMRYKKISWPWKGVILVLALAAASPNLMTLGIYLNSSSAARKAQLTIDTTATWFPSWTIIGAVLGVLLFAGIAVFWHMWRSRGKKMKALKQDLKSRPASASTGPDATISEPEPRPSDAPDLEYPPTDPPTPEDR
ncbi:hypothetical protein CQ018_16620 [Arthrobacter sp. MYb227]|uniref:hypothetical protein n=1 Tax=Arthrobacter sp. MYb227 TaxID=1848601 RepID=UPI000CFD6C32|nr:hypothetical protein [Arthrobacter sp. MYb227]PQZ88615.1 hypothetical protein CQ018_16620 [Arthrobacter sp. MYb227]